MQKNLHDLLGKTSNASTEASIKNQGNTNVWKLVLITVYEKNLQKRIQLTMLF